MTVPGLSHARHLVDAIASACPTAAPRGHRQPLRAALLFGTGLRRADVEQALGRFLAGTIPNNYRLVSEAIDRGVPLDEVKAGNNVSTQT